MLKSTLSHHLFNNFTSSYQSYNHADDPVRPFVYVDQTGVVKLLTSVLEDDASDDGVFAVSVAEDGWMEFLTF